MRKHMEHNRRPAFRPGPFSLVHTFLEIKGWKKGVMLCLPFPRLRLRNAHSLYHLTGFGGTHFIQKGKMRARTCPTSVLALTMAHSLRRSALLLVLPV